MDVKKNCLQGNIMIRHIAYKYRLKPKENQKIFFEKSFGCCRKVWNLMLGDKIRSYEENGSFGYFTPAMYKDEHPYLKEVDSLALANVQLNLQQAFANCFVSRHCGFPKFRSKHKSKKTYTTNNQNGTAAVGDNYVKLPKIGKVKAVIHRKPALDMTVRSVTVSGTSDGKYYASVLFEYNEADMKAVTDETKSIGLDYKSDGLYMDSDGNIGTNHKYFRESQKKLARAQKKLSRMLEQNIDHYIGTGKGRKPVWKRPVEECRNIQKQKRKVAKIYSHTANQRKDNLHKKSAAITKQYDVVCAETLNMRNISNRKFRNGKATMDNGYGMFLNMLEYKLERKGGKIIKVDRYYASTQICSRCGRKHKLSLAERIYRCECGLTIDRDINAARNILGEGLRILRESS